MASSSSSHQQNEERHALSGIQPPGIRRKVDESSKLFDVFINHRGPDVKNTLATQLYNSLQELGIKAFLDSKEKELGDSFPSTIETAIRSAAVHVAIFSKRYAESAWCLAELVLLLQSQAKIIPIFYGVEPWELRHIEKGVYADAFTNYVKNSRYMDRLNQWKEALQSVSLITGFEFNNSESASSSSGLDINNSDEYESIVLAVQKEVKRKKPLFVARYPVALKKLVQDFERRCADEAVEDFERYCDLNVKGIIGIYEMGGAGKTTLAKELFNRKRSEYTRDSFLFDVREASARNELPSLQRKLLKDLFNEEPSSFQSIEEGTCILRERQRRSKMLSLLIVLDDIDDVKQLDALLFMDMQNIYANRLVIVTTRDEGVLIKTGISIRYGLKGMNTNDGRELFCWHSFGQSHPASGYEYLVEHFLQVCGGLPLSLQVLGRHVYGKPEHYWQLELGKARRSMHRDIKDRLKISFDALDWEEKQIFMDISCFLANKPKSVAIRSWEGSGWSAHLALERLKDKCLVEEIEIGRGRLDLTPAWPSFLRLRMHDHLRDEGTDQVLGMHDHLRDLGREMANELTSPHRLWNPQYLKSLESRGFRNILYKTKGRCFHSIFDKSINCEITYFLEGSDDIPETLTALLWLRLDFRNYRPLCLNASVHPDIPSWIPLQNLQFLGINNGQSERFWQSNVKAPSQLKELQIGHTSLKYFPDLSIIADNLEKLTIEDCPNLRRVSRISDLSKLIKLNISKCPELELELSLVGMNCLENITVDECRKLKSLKLKCCKNLKKISGLKGLEELAILNICECPELDYIACLQGLSCLEMIMIDGCGKLNCLMLQSCENLKRVSGNLDLKQLYIRECLELEDIARQTCIEEISIYKYGKPQNITLMISNLLKLKILEINKCRNFEELSVAHLRCVEKMIIKNCRNLKSVSGIFALNKLIELTISECPELELELSLVGMNCLETITVDGCGKLKSIQLNGCKNLQEVSGLKGLEELAILKICECPELDYIACLQGLSCLEMFTIDGCGKLNRLELNSCAKLKMVEGISDLKNLSRLHIRKCLELEELPSLARLSCLEYLDIYKCEKLQSIPGIQVQLRALKGVQLAYCSNAVMRNCIDMLQTVPSNFMGVMGRAGDGAESSFNPQLFDGVIDGDAIIDIEPRSCDPLEMMKDELCALIVCAVVVVHRYTRLDNVNQEMMGMYYLSQVEMLNEIQSISESKETFYIQGEGQWIITKGITCQERIFFYNNYSFNGYDCRDRVHENILGRYGIWKKGCRVMLKKGEEWKTLHVLKTLINRLYAE